jgi:hypothetical protein
MTVVVMQYPLRRNQLGQLVKLMGAGTAPKTQMHYPHGHFTERLLAVGEAIDWRLGGILGRHDP